jgi:hypothetical protein
MKARTIDLAGMRDCLRTACDADVALHKLEVTYMQAGPEGPERVLLMGPGRSGEPLRVMARRMGTTKGRQSEAAINARDIGVAASTGFRKPALYAPSLNVLLQVFPSDDRLPALPVAVDPKAMVPILESGLMPRGAGARLQAVTVRVMRYKPERKCLLRYELAWAGVAPDDTPGVVWARLSRRAKFDRIRDNLPRLHCVAAETGFELPRPLGLLPDLAMELCAPVAGVALFDLVHRDEFPDLCRRVGEGLRRFHGLRVEMQDLFDVEAQVDRLAENATEFQWMLPSEQERIAALERELALRVRAAAPSPLRLIHRDFHGDNVLVHDNRLVLLDFEDCAMGEPADDVGSNWAQLTWHMHKARGKRMMPEAGRRAFLDGYRLDLDESTAACLPTYAAMHCFLYAHQCLRHPQDPARCVDALAMMAACEDVLEHGLH